MDEFRRLAGDLRPRIEEALDRWLPAPELQPARLHEAMRYSVFAGGKRVRPVLLLLAGETFGASRDALLPGAAALEMIHTFSLVHDDLPALDDDDLRRGRPTVHRAYDEATAVLVGDALLNLGVRVVAREPASSSPATRLRALELLTEAVGSDGMIGGQMDDLVAGASWPEDPERALESIHRRKTGALLTAALRIGGAYAGVDAAADSSLEALGDAVGLMFQIADDVLDVEGDARTLGKSAGKDVRDRKLTYPALFGVDGSRRLLAEVRRDALREVERLPANREIFRSLVDYLTQRDR